LSGADLAAMKLDGTVALVTGGAKRVGRAISLALAGRGSAVAIHYLTSKGEAELTASEIIAKGGRASTVKASLESVSETEGMVDAVISRYGRIDILVNSASVFYRTPLEEITESDWDVNLDVNLKAPFFAAKAVAGAMRRQGAGKIVNIGDWAGIRPYRDYLPYTVSKSGLIGLTRALAKALAPQVQVNCIALGPVLPPEDYDPAERKRLAEATLTKHLGSPEDVARAVLFLCEGTDFATGSTLLLDGGRLLA
jgi:NAD(P)-dependent dehydrogenase (short-subunit alcohol dehydrogenase family)